MKKPFTYIFFGLILVMLDYVVGMYDLLPDVLGYLLIGWGTSGLQSYSIHFVTARNLSWALAVFAVALIFARGQAFFFADLVVRVIDLGLVWFLLGGIRELAQSRQRPDLARAAARDRLIYVVLALSTAAGVGLFHSQPEMQKTFQLVVQSALILVLILILILIQRARKHLTDEPIVGVSGSEENLRKS